MKAKLLRRIKSKFSWMITKDYKVIIIEKNTLKTEEFSRLTAEVEFMNSLRNEGRSVSRTEIVDLMEKEILELSIEKAISLDEAEAEYLFGKMIRFLISRVSVKYSFFGANRHIRNNRILRISQRKPVRYRLKEQIPEVTIARNNPVQIKILQPHEQDNRQEKTD